MARIDLTASLAVKRLAELPFYGQAEAIIRRVDPYWKVDLTEPHVWDVRLRQDCDCDCPNCDYYETKTVQVEAVDEDAAILAAEDAHLDWEVDEAKMRPVPTAYVPEELVAEFLA